MDGSEIFSLLESARKPTEFIGGVTSASQSWVQVAICFHPWCSWLCLLPFFMPFWGVCVCVFCIQAALPYTPHTCLHLFSFEPACLFMPLFHFRNVLQMFKRQSCREILTACSFLKHFMSPIGSKQAARANVNVLRCFRCLVFDCILYCVLLLLWIS